MEASSFAFVPRAGIGYAEQNQFLKDCSQGLTKPIKKWIKERKSLAVTDAGGRTALMLTAAVNNEAAFDLVFNASPEEVFNAIDKCGQNVLFYACHADNLARVARLKEKNVKFIVSKLGTVAGEHTRNRDIDRLIHDESQAALHKEAAILKECCDLYGDDEQRLNDEVFKRTGRRIKKTSYHEFTGGQPPEVNPDIKKTYFSHPSSVAEVKRTFQGVLPRNSAAATERLEAELGFRPSREQTKEVLEKAEIKTQSSILNDKATCKAIAAHFKQNRPASIQAAADYVEQTYGVRPEDEFIQKFLAHLGYTYASAASEEQKDDID